MKCPRCKTDAEMLYAVRGGRACAKCKDSLPAPKEPQRVPTTPRRRIASLVELAEQPPAARLEQYGRRHRMGRIAVLKLIEKKIQEKIDAILQRDPDLRGLKFEAAVYAYRESIKIVRRHDVIFQS